MTGKVLSAHRHWIAHCRAAARHPGLNSIGVLALIGLGACFLAAVTVLPALLQVLEDREKKGSG